MMLFTSADFTDHRDICCVMLVDTFQTCSRRLPGHCQDAPRKSQAGAAQGELVIDRVRYLLSKVIPLTQGRDLVPGI